MQAKAGEDIPEDRRGTFSIRDGLQFTSGKAHPVSWTLDFCLLTLAITVVLLQQSSRRLNTSNIVARTAHRRRTPRQCALVGVRLPVQGK